MLTVSFLITDFQRVSAARVWYSLPHLTPGFEPHQLLYLSVALLTQPTNPFPFQETEPVYSMGLYRPGYKVLPKATP